MPPDHSEGFDPPVDLIKTIREGRCVAFVGAGFSQPSMPGWVELLRSLAARIEEPAERRQLEAWLKPDDLGSRDLEGIGARLHKLLGDAFPSTLREIITSREIVEETKKRVSLLEGIPFRAVLTTNFDPVLPRGEVPSPSAYAEILTSEARPWWHQAHWASRGSSFAHLLKLHGQLEDADSDAGLVFTTRSYRQLVHQTPGYRAFLRALFATHPVLYLGFSFTDAYINELRSETLAMLGIEPGSRSKDYAILHDVPDLVAKHLEDDEGLEILHFCTRSAGQGQLDFGGFDRWLEVLHDATSPEASLAALVEGRRILWLDPNPKNNEYAFRVLNREDGSAGHGPTIELVATVEEALQQLEFGGRFDLIISHMGYSRDGSTAERLLRAMPVDSCRRAPVLIFASEDHAKENRETVLRLGGFDYAYEWEDLFLSIRRVIEGR